MLNNQQSASYNKSNKNAIWAMTTSLKYIENKYKDNREFKSILEKWKLNKYAKFIEVSYPNRELLKIIFSDKIDYLFAPWNLVKYTYKSKALRLFLLYLKARFKYMF